tara:strand:+ start:1702 stop:2319 length:618 start_codon:yes stop_codon:yes gene_type:complete
MINAMVKASVVIVILSVSGCARSPDSHFFLLNPASHQALKKYRSCRQTVALDTIKLAKYLDKPNIVTRFTSNHLIVSEFNRWSEPLGDNIQRVLQQNLNYQLKNVTVLTSPIRVEPDINYRVSTQIYMFDMNTKGVTTLKASWGIYNKESRLALIRKKTYHTYAQSPLTYQTITRSMNNALTMLSRDIAVSIKSLSCKKPTTNSQ